MAAPARIIQVAADCPFKIKKLKVRKGQDVSKGTLLCLFTSQNDAVQKFKSCHGGTINNIHVKEGQHVEKGDVMFTLEGCTHPTVMKDMCASCGVDLRLENSTAGNRKEDVTASVAMVHNIPELIVSEQMAKELGKADQDRLLSSRKLVLLVDLDQTIIHTTIDNIPAKLKGVKHFQLWHGNQMMWHHTKFRPGTQQFLEEISKLFELHICTFGSRMYAHTIARILDPEGKFFSYRILSRDECFDANSKTANLKALFPCGDSMVCIIDDREDVWNFVPNMVHVKPYRFFEGTADINAPPGLSKSSEGDRIETKDASAKNETNNEPFDKDEKERAEKPVDETKKEINIDPTEVKEVDKLETGNTERDEIENKEISEGDNVNFNKKSDNTDSLSVFRDKGEGENNKSGSMKEAECENDRTEKLGSVEEGKEEMEIDKTGDKESSLSGGESVDLSDGTITDKANSEQRDNSTNTSKIDSSSKDDAQAAEDEDSEPITQDTKEENSSSKADVKEKECSESESYSKTEKEEIVWEDHDDYLFYLEEILKNIHKAFYDMHDQMKEKTPDDSTKNPSLKDIIPYIKKKVLKGCNIVFSGIIPTNMTIEKSRPYIMAVSLGANVQQEIKNKSNEKEPKNFTTHLIAARMGTSKVRTAVKYKNIKIVTVKWLWSCYERWEKVEEILFLDVPNTKLSEEGRDSPDPSKLAGTKRKLENTDDNYIAKKAKIEETKDGYSEVMELDDNDKVTNKKSPQDDSTEKTDSDNFSMTYNPLYAFSDDDLAYMDKEVEDEIEDEEDESSEEEEARSERIRNRVLSVKPPGDETSSEDSMTGDMPRGWGMKGKMSPKWSSSDEDEKGSSPHEVGPEYESETDQDKFEKIMDAFGPITSSDEDDQESIGSVDEEMADAVMKEFLS